MLTAKFKKTQVKKCDNCNMEHYPGIKCKAIPCPYCLSTHNIKEFKEGMCPLIYEQTAQFRDKRQLICPDCKGLGIYKKIDFIKMEEDQQLFAKRVQEWQKQVKNGKKLQKPVKMIFEHSLVETKLACATCDQQGLVKQRIYCCMFGCVKCNYEGLIDNSTWRKVKMQLKKIDVPVGKSMSCSICMTELSSQQLTYPLQCEHRFHKRCILEWFTKSQRNKNCPNCRQTQKFYPYGSSSEAASKRTPIARQPPSIKILETTNVITKYRSRSRDRNSILNPQIKQNLRTKQTARRTAPIGNWSDSSASQD